ncbi:MAG: hypothetical protein JST79_21605 [Acidobacteria bacterium]|nr:hypothetical protein [Acidobacteriota bacterium]
MMGSAKFRSQGFTLIASLLMLTMLSALSIGLLMMVNTEQKAGAGDLQNTVAYHAAESGVEQMTANLSAAFQSMQAPTPANICGLSASSYQPTISGISYKQYALVPSAGCSATTLGTQYGQIQSGPNAGLYAQLIPVNLTVSAAARSANQEEVAMTRSVQVALIPVFQFGVFSDSDLGFYSSPNLDFAGRVHTNGDLYLGVASSATLTFHDKLSAYGNVVRQQLPNGLASSSYNNTGTVQIPTASSGCDGTKPACRSIALTEGSVTAGPTSSQNSSWPTISQSTYNSMIIDGNYGKSGGTGAKNLSLPFVSGTNLPYEIIRRPSTSGESATSALGSSRLYNIAQIRVLLSDDPSELPGGLTDTDNVRLANVGTYQYGVPTSSTTTMYFATASTGLPDATNWSTSSTSLPPDWPYAPKDIQTVNNNLLTLVPNKLWSSYTATYNAPWLTNGTANPTSIATCRATSCNSVPYYTKPTIPTYYNPAAAAAPSATNSTWNLIDGYLRVEYKDVNGVWHPVTKEWLQLGFARSTTPPKAGVANSVNPNAILILQQPADRNGDGTADNVGTAASSCSSGSCSKSAKPVEVLTDTASSSWVYGANISSGAQSITQYNWYPINFYDAREGEPRDIKQGSSTSGSCTTAGVVNAVEIDVANLKKWLAGTIGTNGTNVDYQAQNGYVLYFSDRRGMLPTSNAVGSHTSGTKSGDSGMEDVVNAANSAGNPDGSLDSIPSGKTLSPEDVNQNGLLDNYGPKNMGLGFYNGTTNMNTSLSPTASAPNPYSTRISSCVVAGRKNWVSGARHVLRLVDGAIGNLPVRPDNSKGGFSVASENPVYIWGDYNSNSSDTIWSTGVDKAHSAAGIVADSVTVLSNAWTDLNSFNYPTDPGTGRNASTTYYRTAIAAGKNMNFPFPSWETSGNYGDGTDGGVHNFLRFLEDWSSSTLNYEGSLVSLYYATYATGAFKCCTYAVYQPPTRNYIFDPNFATPDGLPPGTPMFRDVDSLNYRQILTARGATD